jgi:dynactin 1
VLFQAKLQTVQGELAHLKLSSKQLETSNASLEARLIEMADQLEMVTLDKEFAEEKGESLELELEAEREKMIDLEIEVQLLRDQNGKLLQRPK